MQINMVPYNPAWPDEFATISTNLNYDLGLHSASYLSIEHVGSTAIPSLCAKPILDIMIVISEAHPVDIDNFTYFDKVHFALVFGERQGGYHYIGDGGVSGRWSFKLFRDDVPARNVYVVVKDSMIYRSWVDLREALRKEENRDLKEEYGQVKMRLAEVEWADVMEYSTAKNEVIRKCLKRAGCSDDEVDRKEAGAVRGWFGAGNLLGRFEVMDSHNF